MEFVLYKTVTNSIMKTFTHTFILFEMNYYIRNKIVSFKNSWVA